MSIMEEKIQSIMEEPMTYDETVCVDPRCECDHIEMVRTEDKDTLELVIDNAISRPVNIDNTPMSDKEIIENMKIPFSPVSDRLLVKPLPPVKLTVTHDVIDEEKMDEQKELDDNGVPTLQTKTVTEELDSNLRIGIVLAITETKWTLNTNVMIPEYKIGDKVVYPNKSAMPFDLFKDSVLLRKHDVLGVWLKDIEKVED